MKLLKIHLSILILISLMNCSHFKKSNVKNIAIETNILENILPELFSLDSTDLIFPIFPPPPPPTAQIYRYGKVIKNGTDSIGIKEYKEIISKIDKTRFVYSVEDSTDNSIIDSHLITLNLQWENLFTKYGNLIKSQNKSISKEIPVEFNETKKYGKYELIKRSHIFLNRLDFKKNRNLNLTFYYFGNLIFSCPYLDKTESYGYIIYKRNCGFECDKTILVLIEKQKSKWTITRKIRL